MSILEINDSTPKACKHVQKSLEYGQVVFLPQGGFQLKENEMPLLNELFLAPKQKNISYHHRFQSLSHFNQNYPENQLIAHAMMQRFALYAKDLIDQMFPGFKEGLEMGRTSYRPAKVEGRVSSLLKDDTRLHVDAFSTTPVHGKRILRVFSNINPHDQPRIWHVGEPFADVLNRFEATLPRYSSWKSSMLTVLKLTKSKRSHYDHLMLCLHNQMKRDEHYQQTVKKTEFAFPSNSTWMVFTDQVSHAALSGQYLLEQTFYLPVNCQHYPELSPLHQWRTYQPDL